MANSGVVAIRIDATSQPTEQKEGEALHPNISFLIHTSLRGDWYQVLHAASVDAVPLVIRLC